VYIGDALRNAVRLTFPKGASMKDPKELFNARLDSNSISRSRQGGGARSRADVVPGILIGAALGTWLIA
jgi:hypothetical protein